MKIDPSMYLRNQQVQRDVDRSLGKDDFLQILVTQLQTQNPLQPMKDRQFISQMATFTQLEQTVNMTDMLQSFIQSQSTMSIGRTAAMIGKEITWMTRPENEDEKPQEITGIVNAVSFKGGSVKYITESGDSVRTNAITQIAEASTSPGEESQGTQHD